MPTTAEIYEGSDLTIRLRLVREGDLMQQADLASSSAITWSAYDATGTAVSGASGELSKATTVFDTPQTQTDDAGWHDADNPYNFKATIPAAAFPTGGTTASVFLKFTDDAALVGFEELKITVLENPTT